MTANKNHSQFTLIIDFIFNCFFLNRKAIIITNVIMGKRFPMEYRNGDPTFQTPTSHALSATHYKLMK